MAILPTTSSKILTRHFYGIIITWTLFILCLSLISIYIHHDHIKSLALNEAKSYVQRTRAIRSFILKQGGVYAPTTENLPPSPYITAKPNAIKTDSGQQLTLLSPSYFIKETNSLLANQHMAQVKVTSLSPIDPANLPDEWELQALRNFNQDNLAHSAFINRDGHQILRYMEGFISKTCCLEFYADQGYKLGEVQGGISITMPLTHFDHHDTFQELIILANFFVIWALGVAGIRVSYVRLYKSDLKKTVAEQELRRQKDNLDILVGERTAELEQSLQDLKQSTLLREAAFQATFDSIIILDKNYHIIAINEVGALRLNAEPVDLTGRCLFDLLPEDVARYRQDLFQEAILTGKPVRVENDRRGPYVFETNIVPIYDEQESELLYFAIFASDITSKHKAEQELTRQKVLLEKTVKERTFALAQVNLDLQKEAAKREKAYHELDEQKSSLEEANTALKVLLAQTDSFKKEFQEQILTSISELITPSLLDLEANVADTPAESIVKTIQFHLDNLNSSFSATLSSKQFGLSSREIQIASLIKDERSTKEIAQLLHITPGTVSSYRDNIRKKLHIKNEKINLKTYLQNKFS